MRGSFGKDVRLPVPEERNGHRDVGESGRFPRCIAARNKTSPQGLMWQLVADGLVTFGALALRDKERDAFIANHACSGRYLELVCPYYLYLEAEGLV